MRKYYTLNQAVQRSYKTQESFNRDNNTSFVRSLLNLGRMYFGLQPKFYYFDKKPLERIKSPEPQSFHKNNDETNIRKQEREYLESILDEDVWNYRW